MRNAKKGVAALTALTVAAAGAMASVGAVAAQDDDELIIGVSWNNYNEERWAALDEPPMKAAIEDAGGVYVNTNANSSAEQQLNDIDQLITQGADALIVLAQDKDAILPAVQRAADEGIPFIAYDRIIEDPSVLYMSFDNTRVGEEMAKVIYSLVPEGNYAIIKGNEADENTRFLRAGMETVIGEAVANDDIEIVCETYTDNWDGTLAQTNMENCLTAVDNDIDAVLSENDGMATGVVAALEAQGLQVPVSGQDGDIAALNRVAQGRQAVSVWKDSRILGDLAGKAAVAMATGTPIEEVDGVFEFESPSGEILNTVYVEMDVLTQDNLQEAVDRGRISQEELCADVEPGSVPACP